MVLKCSPLSFSIPHVTKRKTYEVVTFTHISLFQKNGLGWAPWFPEWVLRKKMETYWSCGNAPTLFFSCVHSSLERTLLNQRGLHNRRCKTTRRGTKKGAKKGKRERGPWSFQLCLILSVCLSVSCEKTSTYF